jgi:uncharacterized membrane protein
MLVRDEDGSSRIEAAAAWWATRSVALAGLADRYDVKVFGFDRQLTELPAPSGAAIPDWPASGGNTDVGQALLALRDRLLGRRPAAALILSDGADRAALGRASEDEVEQQLAGLGFPVSVLSLGDPLGFPDQSVHPSEIAPFGFVRRPLELAVAVRRRGLGQGPIPVTLRADGEVVAEQHADPPDGGEAPVNFRVTPDAVGYRTFSITIPTPAADALPSNNQLDLTVKIVRDRTRVLQLTSRPSWDVRALRRLLKSDPNIDLVSFFILRGSRMQGELVRSGELSLIEFPYDSLFGEDLAGFDLVVFQNFSFETFLPTDASPLMLALADSVRAGGALLMIGGDASFAEGGYLDNAVRDILPAWPTGEPPASAVFQAVATPAGLRHPGLRIARDTAANAAAWMSLPPLQGWNVLAEPADGGIVLARAGEGGPPLIAARTVGKGRTVAVATDTTWRWALGRRAEADAAYATVMRNLVRWLVRDSEEHQVQVLTDRENYRVGDEIQVTATVLGDDFAPRPGVPLSVAARTVSAGAIRNEDGVTDVDGQFRLTLPAEREGTLAISATVPSIAEPFGTAGARVSISDRDGESEEAGARPDVLARIAAATGGIVLPRGGDPASIPTRGAAALATVHRKAKPLASHPLVLLGILLPLGAEVMLRRRAGLR